MKENASHEGQSQGKWLNQQTAKSPLLNALGGDPGGEPVSQENVESLLRRMRNGDREAAAQFIIRYEDRIRRRIRGKLNPSMRRLFDSQDIFSTVGRRLDQYVRTGKLEAQSENQLWALIFRMATNAVIDKSRMYRRLQKAEGLDSQFAQELMSRFRQAERRDKQGVEIEIDSVVNLLSDDIDREILTQWLFGSRLIEIAQSIGMAHTGVRKRWQKIRELLQSEFLQESRA